MPVACLSHACRAPVTCLSPVCQAMRTARRDMDVQAQVHRLIREARSHENLCQSYIGWCPFW